MPVSITANLASQYAQQSVRERSDSVNKNTQQLSSGLRVFSAVQDAAALAVGAGLKIDNAGLVSARINASAGVSMLQIADGGLGNVADILVRMKALAVQAGSGHLSDSDRIPIDLEFQNLKSELNRLAASTQFNGVKLLDGQPGYAVTGASNTSADGISGISFNSRGLSGDPVVRYTYDAGTEQMTMTRIDNGSASTQTLGLAALLDATAGAGGNLASGQAVKLNFNAIGITLTLGSGFNRAAAIAPTATDNSGADIAVTTAAFVPGTTNFTTEGVDGLLALAGGYDPATGALTLPLNTNSTAVTLGPLAGVSFAVNGGAVGASGAASADLVGAGTYADVYVDTASGTELVGRITTATIATTGNTDGSLVINAGRGLFGAELQDANSDTVLNYKIGTGVIVDQDILQVSLPPVNVASLGLTNNSLSTLLAANASIDVLTPALQVVSSARATVGAQQSRLSSVTASIDVFRENNEGARSALMDTDVPATISALANDQATLQAGIAMLAQSNRIPDMLLSLLRNG